MISYNISEYGILSAEIVLGIIIRRYLILQLIEKFPKMKQRCIMRVKHGFSGGL